MKVRITNKMMLKKPFNIPIKMLLGILFFGVLFVQQTVAQTVVETAGNFNLYSNGTVKCTAAANLETGTLNSITYTKRTKAQITTGNAATSCTSGITSMASKFQNAVSFNQDISSWDVSSVTNMSSMFTSARAFNRDLSSWDVSNVKTMSSMFYGSHKFNQDISSWDVSSVTNMSNMFGNARAFNQDISSWDVSSVTTMYAMFFTSLEFNQDISSWDVSSVTNMDLVFNTALKFNQDLSTWCVFLVGSTPNGFGNSGTDPVWGTCTNADFSLVNSNTTVSCTNADVGDGGTLSSVTYIKRTKDQITEANAATTCTSGITEMKNLFKNATTFNEDISTWDMGTVTRLDSMFYGAVAFNQDITKWDVEGVNYFSNMFSGASSFNQSIGSWDISVSEMTSMFSGASSFNQDLNWSVENVTDMSNVFYEASAFNGDITSWDVSNVTKMDSMFYGATVFNKDISSWNVSVSEMTSMFSGASSFNQDLNWSVENVTDMSNVFYGASAFNGDITSWNLSSTTKMNSMFSGATAFNKNISSWDVSNVTDMTDMFRDATTFDQNIGSWDVIKVSVMGSMFLNATAFNQDLSGWCVPFITEAPINFKSNSFNEPNWSCANVQIYFATIDSATVKCPSAANGDFGALDGIVYTKRYANQITVDNAPNSCTTGITVMNSLFKDATTFNGDISSWDVESVTNMDSMFYNASAFNRDLSNWDVSKVTTMSNMFNQASVFNMNISSWEVSEVEDMSYLFSGASVFNQNISSWDVDSVTTMSSMFSDASAFNQDISSWHVNKVKSMDSMFYNASAFDQNIGSWDVSKVTDMGNMFSGSNFIYPVFNQDISNWDVSSVTNMRNMFYNATTFNQNIGNWDVSNVTNMSSLFFGNTVFNQDISGWDVSSVTDMGGMFITAEAFNQDISGWDVSKVTTMNGMFFGANAFNQNISSWCVTNITTEPPVFGNAGTDPIWGTCSVIQRVISGDVGWRLLSFPITGGTVNDISDDTPIQGITGGDNEDAAANFYLYDDTGAYEEPTNVSSAFGDGKGFAVYFYDNANAGSVELPIDLYAAGSEPSSNVAVTLNPLANGYTLVGNPFKSNFSADATNMAVSGADFIQNNITFWNDGLGTYSVQDRTTPYIIKPWQGFWVQLGGTGGATTLTFNTSGKTTSTETGSFFSKTVASNRGDINFIFSSDSSYDEAIRLSFRDNATTGYDPDDAGKLLPLLSKYAIMGFNSNELYKSVESLPWDLQEEITIPMEEVLVGVNGGFTLEWNGFESIPEEWELTFHDYLEEISMDMRNDSIYTFDAVAPANKMNPMSVLNAPEAIPAKSKSNGTRFAITINPNTTSVGIEAQDLPNTFTLEQNYPNPFNPSTTITYSVENTGQVTVIVYNLMGQKVSELVNSTKAAGRYTVNWDASSSSSGMYFYQLTAGGQTLTKRMTLIK
ncbi:MAG: hypothetical protein BalsKO_15420 [Balneolaceae bacterium]